MATVGKPERLWQSYNMPQYNHETETFDHLRHLGTFRMKPPYRFGTHEDYPLAKEYIRLEPSVLTIASSAMADQRGNHVFLSERHAADVTKTNAAITELSKTINIDSWGQTAAFPYETMRSALDTSFDEHGNAGGKPSYQWYTKIEVACQNFRKTLIDWRRYNEEVDLGFRNNLSEHDLPNQIARLNRMHREISGIDDLMHVADGIHLVFRYQRLWTEDKMKRVAPVAVSILGVVPDLQIGLPNKRLALRRSSPLSRVQSRFASSPTPTVRPTRYLLTWVQTIWVRSTSNTGPCSPTPRVLSTQRIDRTLCVQRRRTRCHHRPCPAGDHLPD